MPELGGGEQPERLGTVPAQLPGHRGPPLLLREAQLALGPLHGQQLLYSEARSGARCRGSGLSCAPEGLAAPARAMAALARCFSCSTGSSAPASMCTRPELRRCSCYSAPWAQREREL